MVDRLDWLALEVKYLDRARAFYEAFLDLEVRDVADTEVAFPAGGTDLILRAPSSVPRGGLHTHFACSIPAAEYDAWYDQLDERFDLVEETFGDATSLYFYDPDGHCVELGQSDVAGPGIGGVFEVVFEVEELDRAVRFYEALGFDPVDRAGDRERVRLTAGSFDIELWEPQLGIADARGGVHADVGFGTATPEETASAVENDALAITQLDDGVRVRDPDGHYLTLVDR